MAQNLRALVAVPGVGGISEVAAHFRLHRTEDIGRPTAFVLTIVPRFAARGGRSRRTNMGMERHGLFVQANYWFFRVIRSFVDLRNIFQAFDLVVVKFGDAPHFFPATAGGRGAPARSELLLFPPAAPTVA